MRRTVPLIVLFGVLIVAAVPARGDGYLGTITSSGYLPPANVPVTWCQIGAGCRTFTLNPAVLFDGQSAAGKYGRYAQGDRSVQGWYLLPAMGGEAKGGEVGAALLRLYQRAGIARQYTEQELWDFGFANSCGGPLCDCHWYVQIIGEPHPTDPACGATPPPPPPPVTCPGCNHGASDGLCSLGETHVNCPCDCDAPPPPPPPPPVCELPGCDITILDSTCSTAAQLAELRAVRRFVAASTMRAARKARTLAVIDARIACREPIPVRLLVSPPPGAVECKFTPVPESSGHMTTRVRPIP